VHSHEEHLFAFISLCAKRGITGLALHLFLDGRDMPPQSAMNSLVKLEHVLKANPVGRIASICGRYYAMDRDNRWERVSQAYKLLTEGQSKLAFEDPQTALNYYYDESCFDEFIPPTVIGKPIEMRDGDSVFFFNFRSDRARQLTQALVEPNFTNFTRSKYIQFQHVVTMTQYQAGLPTEILFPPVELKHMLGEVLSISGLKQLRLAETEKYAHVTFFLNGGNEAVFPGEERILVPSPKVATYDLAPAMSAKAITEQLKKALCSYDVILCNYANADMVGHTGVMEAATEAITCLDQCMAEIGKAVKQAGGTLLITADHGNAEVMYDEDLGQPHTAHTMHLVPFLFIGEGWHYRGGVGSLSDIAPTILTLLGLKQPAEMTGHSLLIKE
jgi:2,3-bisphosphoglycerate-independent phosphoglycerate mutase